MRTLSRRILSRAKGLPLVLAFLAAIAIFMGLRWAAYERQPLPEAAAALESDDQVTVTADPWLAFSPTQTDPQTGFIFYPGGRIDPRGYAPLLNTIAAEGYLVVIPEMPLNMAPFNANVAAEIIADYPDISHWVIGGHSVGGTMAAQFTKSHEELIDGLVIWASYPAGNAGLAHADLPTAVIYGSLDPRANEESVMARQDLLPEDTSYTRIEGGGHHQFGSYEIEAKEHQAVIERDAQQQQIIQETLNLLAIVPTLN